VTHYRVLSRWIDAQNGLQDAANTAYNLAGNISWRPVNELLQATAEVLTVLTEFQSAATELHRIVYAHCDMHEWGGPGEIYRMEKP
jgi:hypothetical protein